MATTSGSLWRLCITSTQNHINDQSVKDIPSNERSIGWLTQKSRPKIRHILLSFADLSTLPGNFWKKCILSASATSPLMKMMRRALLTLWKVPHSEGPMCLSTYNLKARRSLQRTQSLEARKLQRKPGYAGVKINADGDEMV